jgi:hypothetical protein
VPGRLNQVMINLPILGTAWGQCSELCGVNHGFMPIEIKVLPIHEFLYYIHLKALEVLDDLLSLFTLVLEPSAEKLTEEKLSKLIRKEFGHILFPMLTFDADEFATRTPEETLQSLGRLFGMSELQLRNLDHPLDIVILTEAIENSRHIIDQKTFDALLAISSSFQPDYLQEHFILDDGRSVYGAMP